MLDGGIKAMWVKIIYKPGHYKKSESKENKIETILTRMVFRCNDQTFNSTSTITYDENGKVLSKEQTQLKHVVFEDIVPITMGFTFLKYACEKERKRSKF